jgi:hypothetical protein
VIVKTFPSPPWLGWLFGHTAVADMFRILERRPLSTRRLR